MEDKIKTIKEEAEKLLDFFNSDYETVITFRERNFFINISLSQKEGSELSKITDSLQYLLRAIVEKKLDDRIPLIVDINGYKSIRTKNIEDKARRMAHLVRTTKKPVELHPMNSFERRLVHTIVSNIADITSESTGEGFERRVVIKPALG